MAATLRTYLELVRFSHTIFALPFAVMAGLIAAQRDATEFPGRPLEHWLWLAVGILACMATARTAAMAFNRLVDREIDSRNPRTASRHLPAGLLLVGDVTRLVLISSGLFVAATLLFLPNWLPIALSLPVLAWLLGYSYAKRFTPLAHLWLGAALGLAPLAAWIAVRGPSILVNPADLLPAAVLAAAVTTWVAGFDTIYACQDAEFDAAENLQSLPSRFGVAGALRIAAGLHLLTIVCLATLPVVTPELGTLTGWAVTFIAGLLFIEHLLVGPRDLSRVNQAFFGVNAVIGLLLLAAIAADLWL
jgi:4-hydroxybenzoate polyprenyltransferase